MDVNHNTPPAEEAYSLEDIMAEYGGSLEDRLLRETAEPAAPQEEPEAPPERDAPSAPAADSPVPPAEPPPPEGADPSPEELLHPPLEPMAARPEPPAPPLETPDPPPEAPAPPPEAPDPPEARQTAADVTAVPHPRPLSLEDVVGSTVDAVMEERREAAPPPKRAGRSSRKAQEEPEAPPKPPPEPEIEPIGPEPSLWEAAHAARQHYIRRKHTVLLPLTAGLAPTLLLLLDHYQVKVPYWSGEPRVQCVFLLACLLLTAVLCGHVFIKAFTMLRRRRCVAELLVSLSVLVSGADCAARILTDSAGGAMPYASVTCLSLLFAQWGVRRESKGNYDMLRSAAVDDNPPYLVTSTPQGACKQRGSVPGFYTTAVRSDAATLWQTALLPVFLAAAVVFALLSSVGQERGGDFLLNLSAILPAAATFSLPLCWTLPWSRLAEHLQKTGCAVAGWSGAQKISAQRRMIVTDTDLFPPGTVQLSGRKLFAETQERALSLAASMARAAGSGLERLFSGLVRSEGGLYEQVDGFSFHDEGGWSGVIKGETVLMGSASFMRRMSVRLPPDVNPKTGIFLAADRELIAVFAVKYSPAENVDFALRMMQRSRIQPILASRDPNITPSLLRRKFSRNIHIEYPGLTERIALSEAEKDRDLPRALLFREGLLPYAEAVTGSLRLCKAVRRAAAISLLGGWAGILLTFYLTSLGAYELLSPLALEAFLLLWTLPVLLITDWAGRY